MRKLFSLFSSFSFLNPSRIRLLWSFVNGLLVLQPLEVEYNGTQLCGGDKTTNTFLTPKSLIRFTSNKICFVTLLINAGRPCMPFHFLFLWQYQGYINLNPDVPVKHNFVTYNILFWFRKTSNNEKEKSGFWS